VQLLEDIGIPHVLPKLVKCDLLSTKAIAHLNLTGMLTTDIAQAVCVTWLEKCQQLHPLVRPTPVAPGVVAAVASAAAAALLSRPTTPPRTARQKEPRDSQEDGSPTTAPPPPRRSKPAAPAARQQRLVDELLEDDDEDEEPAGKGARKKIPSRKLQ
jgi:hypothetical protein